ncbi:MAG: polysaccharide biosynthesis tyrosine autokinase [Prochlorococcaceae cyanobacterium]
MPPQNPNPQLSGHSALAGQTVLATPTGLVVTGYTGANSAAKDGEGGGFDFRNLLQIFQRRRKPFLITLVLITAVQAARTLHERYVHPVYAGNFTLLITDPVNAPTETPGNEGAGALTSLARNSSSVDLPTLLEVLQSGVVLGPVFETLKSEGVAPGELPSIALGMANAVSPEAGPSFGVVQVRARGSDPQVLKRGLELTEKAYLAWATSQRQERLSDGLRFLEEQEPRLRSNSESLQMSLQRFREANTLIEPTEEAVALRAQLEELQQRLLGQQGELKRLDELRADVASGRLSAREFSISGDAGSAGEGGVGASASGGGSVSANLPSQSQLDELQRLEQEIAQAEANFKPGSPVLASLKASRDTLLPRIRGKQMEAVDAALRQNANAIATTKAQISRLEGQFQNQPELLRQFEGLQKRLEIANGNLESYLQAREQFQLELAQRSSPWKVISASQVGDVPVEPALGRGLMEGLLLGVLGGAAVAFLRERLDHVFHSPQEVRDELNVPLLGHMPYVEFFDGVRREKRFLINELDQQSAGAGGYQRFFYQESLRNLYTSLRFLSTEKPLRSVAITSSLPSEGKSLLNVLLAKTLSELGQRVLLVDADLRKPQIHYRLGMDNLRGLSNLLTEEAASWREVVQQVPDYPGWSVLTAGLLPPDPPRLLGSERMDQIVGDLAKSGEFDLILYDTPPALGLADAALIAQHLEGIVLLVSLNRVDRGLPAQSLERIREAGAPLLGVVTNARRKTAAQEPGYGYGYGYGSYGTYGVGAAYGYYGGTAESPKPAVSVAVLPKARRGLRRLGRRVSTWLDR